jgi:hypothetical protein
MPTPAFKKWFGNWEQAARIDKLKSSKTIVLDGDAYKGKYELNAKSAKKYIQHTFQQNSYINKDTGDRIIIGKSGRNKVTAHSKTNSVHPKSIAHIPEMIEKAIFVDEYKSREGKKHFDSYRYYVAEVSIDNIDYLGEF